MPKSLFSTAAYKKLVKNVSQEFADLEALLKRQTAIVYWRVGRYIHKHLLENKDRADYGATLLENLAKDVDRDRTVLQRGLQFYRLYPIRADQHELSWDHYKRLITIKDDKERKTIELKAIKNDWSTTKLGEYLAVKRELTAPVDDGKPVPQLKFTRGRLNTYQIVAANKEMIEHGPLAIDLGFREQEKIPASAGRVKEGDIVVKAKGRSFTKCTESIKADELFTYVAKVDKVIDGDTLLVAFRFGLTHSVSQKLRLRGIDCPEMDTEEGKKAKRFVEARLKDCAFIIVKTYKDRTDNWDRYVTDVFYLPKINQNNLEEAEHAPRAKRVGATTILEGCTDCAEVAAEGIYLNQELLDNHLAMIWK